MFKKCYLFNFEIFQGVKKPYLFIILISFSFIMTFYFALRVKICRYPDMTSARRLLQIKLKESYIKENGTVCLMPKLNPFAPEMLKFVLKVNKVICKDVDWVECIFDQCRVKKKILNKMKNMECTYKDIVYVDDENYYFGPSVKVLNDEPYNLSRSDHVKISCKGTDKRGFGLVLRPPRRWGGNKAGFRPVKVPSTDSEEKPLNILCVIFDSTSKNSFKRLMPKSLKYLTEELNAVVMNSYNIVGDGTAEALMPMLTGHYFMELPDARNTGNNTKKVDLSPFIFKLLKDKGYRTAYFEDSPDTGTFQYRFNGFTQQPTDHYLRSFFQEENKLWSLITKKKNCVSSQPVHVFLFNLTRQFFLLPGKKFCLTFSATLSHDDLSMLSTGDDDLVDFLKQFQSWGRNDTLLFIMGDHGTRFAEVRNTYQGRIEERLPFVSVVIPELFKKKRPLAEINLKANSEILTTPYDIHATMLDFLGLKQYKNQYKVPGSMLRRSLSFFEPIPRTRTCAEAFITPYYCACTIWHNISVFDPIYYRTGRTLAAFINNLTAERRSLCTPRSLISVGWVLRMSDTYNNVLKDDKDIYYQVKITMSPGIAMYEGSLKYIVEKDDFTLSANEISRTNAYGDEPDCLNNTEPRLNMFCYCRNKLPPDNVTSENSLNASSSQLPIKKIFKLM